MPALGPIWSHCVCTRYILNYASHQERYLLNHSVDTENGNSSQDNSELAIRTIRLVKSPFHKDSMGYYSIDLEGIKAQLHSVNTPLLV